MSLRHSCLIQFSKAKSFLQIILYIVKIDASMEVVYLLLQMNQYQLPWFPPPQIHIEVIIVRIDVGQHRTVCTEYVHSNAYNDYQASLLMDHNNIVSTSECVIVVFNLPDISSLSAKTVREVSNIWSEPLWGIHMSWASLLGWIGAWHCRWFA